MMKKLFYLGALVCCVGFIFLGCMDREPAPMCPVPVELKASRVNLGTFDGVDILVVLDNSKSMKAEQEILATSFFPLINSLINPTEGIPATEDIRIGIVTSDMGLQYDGKDPSDEMLKKMTSFSNTCTARGDSAKFVTDYLEGATVNIFENVIPCNPNAKVSQCPPGWSCVQKDGKSTCSVSSGTGENQNCPKAPTEKKRTFVDLDDSSGWTVEELPFTTACLAANIGTQGCNFEQQLAAASAGLTVKDFIREKSLTAIIIVSDEEDCSIKDPKWFDVEEFNSGENTANLACGKHQEFLYSIKEIKKMYDDKKKAVSNKSGGIVFAAIVGVPTEKSANCQGTGNDISTCLNTKLKHGSMKAPGVVTQQRESAGQIVDVQFFEYACERFKDDAKTEAVTQAFPGTRYVELAQEYGHMGYVYSICNENWSPAMTEIAKLIKDNLTGSCFSKRLAWNPQTETADCNMVYSYRFENDDEVKCPTDNGQQWEEINGQIGQITEQGEDEFGTPYTILACTAKKLAVPRKCSKKSKEYANDNETFGWFYCENEGENNAVACNDNKDNDNDGKTDCDDPDCQSCSNCPDAMLHDKEQCPNICPYMISLTPTAENAAGDATVVTVDCIQEFKFEDPNCTENSKTVCSDGLDNDGNGPFDCNNVTLEDATDDIPAHFAEPACCPMKKGEKGTCIFLNSDGTKGNGWKTICGGNNIPDACIEASIVLECKLP